MENKFKTGATIKSMKELTEHLGAGRWLYMHGTPKHPAVLRCMTYGTLEHFIRHGGLKVAVLNKPKKGD